MGRQAKSCARFDRRFRARRKCEALLDGLEGRAGKIEATVGAVLAAAAIPIVLGGDHSIAEPDIRACAAAHGPVGLVHFDAHTDTARECFGAELSHGTSMYRLVEAGHVPTISPISGCSVSPMLASHAGLDTAESSLDDVAAKVAAAAAALAEEG